MLERCLFMSLHDDGAEADARCEHDDIRFGGGVANR